MHLSRYAPKIETGYCYANGLAEVLTAIPTAEIRVVHKGVSIGGRYSERKFLRVLLAMVTGGGMQR